MKKPRPVIRASAFLEKLAATYSRGVYKTTTIGKTVFDGRVRNGNGSDHSFMATKKSFVKTADAPLKAADPVPVLTLPWRTCRQRFNDSKSLFSENCTQGN